MRFAWTTNLILFTAAVHVWYAQIEPRAAKCHLDDAVVNIVFACMVQAMEMLGVSFLIYLLLTPAVLATLAYVVLSLYATLRRRYSPLQ